MPGLDLDEDNNTTTRLLTLLNVSALKSSKRKGTGSIEPTPRVKLNKRRAVQPYAAESASTISEGDEGKDEAFTTDAAEARDIVVEDIEDDQGACGPLPVTGSALFYLTVIQMRNKTRTKNILAHKVPTYLLHPRAQWNVAPGEPADRTGGLLDPSSNPPPKVPLSMVYLPMETPWRWVCFPADFTLETPQLLLRSCRDLKLNLSLPNRS